MTRTSESEEKFFLTRVCDCDAEDMRLNWLVPLGHPVVCRTCGKWARHTVRMCIKCGHRFVYAYQHPRMNLNTCWGCCEADTHPYIHQPKLQKIPPANECLWEQWTVPSEPYAFRIPTME